MAGLSPQTEILSHRFTGRHGAQERLSMLLNDRT